MTLGTNFPVRRTSGQLVMVKGFPGGVKVTSRKRKPHVQRSDDKMEHGVKELLEEGKRSGRVNGKRLHGKK